MMQGIAENTEIDVDEIDTLSFPSFLPRRERPLLAGNFLKRNVFNLDLKTLTSISVFSAMPCII